MYTSTTPVGDREFQNYEEKLESGNVAQGVAKGSVVLAARF